MSTKPKDGDKPGHVDITFRITLGEAWTDAMELVNQVQMAGHEVSLLVCKRQLGLGDLEQ